MAIAKLINNPLFQRIYRPSHMHNCASLAAYGLVIVGLVQHLARHRPTTTSIRNFDGQSKSLAPLLACGSSTKAWSQTSDSQTLPGCARPEKLSASMSHAKTLMPDTQPKIRKSLISGRELFVCDNLVEPMMVQQVGTLVRALHYIRKEKSRPGVPGVAAVADIAPDKIAVDPFLRGLRQTVERLFPGEQFTDQRAYVNCSVYGDSYYAHRDCGAQERHVTALYYANLEWQLDWGGETIYYNDEEDAELVILPRPGRLVVARGAVLHRGCVPTRACHEERYTLAYKLNSIESS